MITPLIYCWALGRATAGFATLRFFWAIKEASPKKNGTLHVPGAGLRHDSTLNLNGDNLLLQILLNLLRNLRENNYIFLKVSSK